MNERDTITSPVGMGYPDEDDLDEKHVGGEFIKKDEIQPVPELAALSSVKNLNMSPEIKNRILHAFGRKAEAEDLAPSRDVEIIWQELVNLSDEQATEILLRAIDVHSDDPNFPSATMTKIRQLVLGYKASDMDVSEWEFELKVEAAMIHFHSPYPEVRSATQPFDDPSEPVETFRAYFMGLCLVSGSSALNTFFNQRQPQINLGAPVLQVILAMWGKLWARVMPDWGFTVRGHRISLNHGPWSYKEQVFATIMFTIASGSDSIITTLLIQSLPIYLPQTWMNYGYELLLALSTRLCGYGFAGMLRRFVIYPPAAIFPSVLPTLVLSRALILNEKRERINGWGLSRNSFFWIFGTLMFIYFWIPNFLFTALHSFNWMTWIAPNNANLAVVTGFYGGLGFNPWATFDWNVSGSGSLTTPFYAQLQPYFARILSGCCILAMYYSNKVWSGYMPINSNVAFNNKGVKYNTSALLDKNAQFDITKYKKLGPPYLPADMVWIQGARLGWYGVAISYYGIRMGKSIWVTAKTMFRSMRFRGDAHAFAEFEDPHSRMMRRYKEVPDWWYLMTIVVSMVFGCVALGAWPTHVPWYSILYVGLMTSVLVLPSAIVLATANISVGYNTLFQIMGGLWFPGNQMANLVITSYGENFNNEADNYIGDLKLAHYAKLPQRAVFRGQIIAVLVGACVWVGMVDWLVNVYNDGTLCQTDNKQHFVCVGVNQQFALATEYGALGSKNFFLLYPFLPYCLLIGAAVGVSVALLQMYGARIREWCERRLRAQWFDPIDRFFFKPMSVFRFFNPPVFWSGSWGWAGGNNLSFFTNKLYISFLMMYYVKRRYGSWWEKYNYLLEAAFGVGLALSGTVQTLAFKFGPNIQLNWWGNSVATAGIDYEMYNNKAARLTVPKGGYFGLAPEQYPMDF